MRVQIFSDLHLEMNPCAIPVVGDVVILAGDIHVGARGVVWAKEHFAGRPVIYVAGNHEYYGHVFPSLMEDLREAAAGSNVVFLERGSHTVGNVRFLGATLWTDFTLHGEATKEISMMAAKQSINDFRGSIKLPSGELLQPRHVAQVHRETRDWLRQQLALKHDGPTVVISHHAPVRQCNRQLYWRDPLEPAFANNLEDLILDNASPVALWVSGHTHFSTSFSVGTTRIISNQRGYSDHDDNGGFQPDLVVDV